MSKDQSACRQRSPPRRSSRFPGDMPPGILAKAGLRLRERREAATAASGPDGASTSALSSSESAGLVASPAAAAAPGCCVSSTDTVCGALSGPSRAGPLRAPLPAEDPPTAPSFSHSSPSEPLLITPHHRMAIRVAQPQPNTIRPQPVRTRTSTDLITPTPRQVRTRAATLGAQSRGRVRNRKPPNSWPRHPTNATHHRTQVTRRWMPVPAAC